MKRLVRFSIPFLLGAILTALFGWLLLGDRSPPEPTGSAAEAAPAQVWTCSMHPQIRMDHKGRCPLCGMELTPVDARQDPWESADPKVRLVLSDQAQRMARVQTAEVLPRELFKDLRTVGRVEFDETRVAYIAARVNGRVDQVYADFSGTNVRQGEHLVSIYSPELLSTQEEFLAALRGEQASGSAGRNAVGGLSAASRRRLLLWGITREQIDALAASGQAQDHLVVYAPIGGTVVEKNVRPGQYVKEGDALYTIADLGRVWLVLEVYESELAWVRVGQAVEVTLESQPHEPLTGTVSFIEPVVTSASRTVRVRVIVENPDLRLKPGMYAQALLRVPLLPGGRPAPTGLEGKYVCPMHPYEISDQPGPCRQCGMPLERVPADSPGKPRSPPGSEEKPKVLAVPAEAVLTTGLRQLVYVEKAPGKYQLVEPKLGPRAGDYYPVWSGLVEGDRVVTRGNFLLDSQFQITGRTSLLAERAADGLRISEAAEDFTADERANLERLSPEDRQLAARQRVCPITGEKLGSMGVPYKMEVQGRVVFLCCQGCEEQVKADPAAALEKLPKAAQTRHAPAAPAAPHGGGHG